MTFVARREMVARIGLLGLDLGLGKQIILTFGSDLPEPRKSKIRHRVNDKERKQYDGQPLVCNEVSA